MSAADDQAFGFALDAIAQALRGLTSLPSVRCEDAAAVAEAIGALAAGLDFADALHLASGRAADEGFARFDTRFVKRAPALARRHRAHAVNSRRRAPEFHI